jgi:hypothetical protein
VTHKGKLLRWSTLILLCFILGTVFLVSKSCLTKIRQASGPGQARPEPPPQPPPPRATKGGLDSREFPWPPPEASARMVVPDSLLRKAPTIPSRVGQVEQLIREALDTNGYSERSYFAVPNGFAMITRMEQYDDDGKSMNPPERWAVEVSPFRKFSLSAYIEALFTASPGRYRIIAFIVTPTAFSESSVRVSREHAMNWLIEGLNKLPDSMIDQDYSSKHTCTALVYEFFQPTRGAKAYLTIPGQYTAMEHLTKSRLWASIQK